MKKSFKEQMLFAPAPSFFKIIVCILGFVKQKNGNFATRKNGCLEKQNIKIRKMRLSAEHKKEALFYAR